MPMNETAVVELPAHTAWLLGWFTAGTGFTVIVKFFAAPVQVTPPEIYSGVTIMVPEIGTFVPFAAVKDGMLPAPPAPSPMVVLLLVQSYELADPENTGSVVSAPAQIV